jgi:hypothetical protein
MARKEREKLIDARMELEPNERPKRIRSADPFGAAWIIFALERLKRELSAARRITHPNVIRIHDISDSEGLHFVSME